VERRWGRCRDTDASTSGKRPHGPWCATHDTYWPSAAQDCRLLTDRLDDAESLLLDLPVVFEALAHESIIEKQERWGTRRTADGAMFWWTSRKEAEEVINAQRRLDVALELVHEGRLVSDWKEVPS
jgi:hypothetical protein